MAQGLFPAGFEPLERFAADWMLADLMERQRERSRRTLEQVRAFYDGLFPDVERIIDYLKGVPMEAMSRQDKNLYRLIATWMEMSHPIDLGWNDTDERDVFPFERVHLREPSPGDY